MKKGDIYYFARILPTVGMFDVIELIIRTVADDWFVGTDKREKRAYLFSNKDIGKIIFEKRKDALDLATREESDNKKKFTTYYEEY